MQADQYVRTAVRRSPEGVIIMPSAKAERAYDLARLNEIAQALRQPAALCFVERGIETIRLGEVDGETAYVDIPEGQAKFRARIDLSGQTMRVEVLETGFKDEQMERCVLEAIEAVKWPPSRTSQVQRIDVVYWVSLGLRGEDESEAMKHAFREQQALAAMRGRQCLEGRLPLGTYEITGLALLDREGRTVATRIDPGTVGEDVAGCLTAAFREVRMPRSQDAFIRPFTPRVEFSVGDNGIVSFADERWLKLIRMEQAAQREARRAELQGASEASDSPPPIVLPGEGGEGSVDAPPSVPATPTKLPKQTPKSEPASGEERDPGKGGQKLDLLGR